MLLDHATLRPEARARFAREARATASLDHPHICVVHDIANDEGIDFVVMELLRARRSGPDLSCSL
jgi:serine/threonine protein kinase